MMTIQRRPRTSQSLRNPRSGNGDHDDDDLPHNNLALHLGGGGNNSNSNKEKNTINDTDNTSHRNKDDARKPKKILSSMQTLLLRRCHDHHHHHLDLKLSSSTRWAAPATIIIVISLLSSIIIIIISLLLQIDAYVREYQGPLDYVTTSSLWEPYYGMVCPIFSPMTMEENPTNGYSNEEEQFSWDCDGITTTTTTTTSIDNGFGKEHTNFPRIFMIGARGEDEDTFHSWNQTLHNRSSLSSLSSSSSSQHIMMPHLERINTLKISNQYALSGGKLLSQYTYDDNTKNHHYLHPTKNNNYATIANSSSPSSPTFQNDNNNRKKKYLCRALKWEHRLFAVYQTVFSRLLSTYPHEDGFVFVEDDAVLANPRAFRQEVCHAHNRHRHDDHHDHHDNNNDKFGFYSLYRSPLQSKGSSRPPTPSSPQLTPLPLPPTTSCMYLHGTVAFYIRRHIMERIANERRREMFCRFPIDMYISKMGPWYATRREVVGHLDMGRVGSTV